MSHHQPHQRPIFIQRWYVYSGIGRESSIMSSFLGKPSNWFQQVLIPVRPVESSNGWKASELVNRKCILFHQHNANWVFLWWPGKNCYSLAGRFWFISYIHQTLHLQIYIYFGLCKILLMEKISTSWKIVKGTWNSYLPKKIKCLGRWDYEVAWKMAEDGGTKWWICCSIKVLVKMEKYVFYFYFKTKGTLWPTDNYMK